MSARGPRDAIVVGGGIAGVSAALRLAERGVRVTLLETRKKLGGRATSFTDARTGETLDNCQHVAMGCCANYLDLCARLGVADKLAWTERIHWIEEGGRVSTMRPGPWPAPGHFCLSFARAGFLSARERFAVARAMLAAARADRGAWADRTFGDWLAATHQPARAVARFWSPIIVSACNLDVSRVCAATALHVIQDGFLAHRRASEISVAGAPLVELYDPAIRAIERAGGVVRLGASAASVSAHEVTLVSGETLRADAIICATPPERTVRLVDEAAQRGDARFAGLSSITHSPILGVHLWFDRPVMPYPHATLVERPTQWLFRKDDAGRRVHAVVSAADEWIALDEETIGARVLEDVRACLPGSRDAALERVRAVKEKLATFAATPEVERRRPETTGESGVILAGCYVQTGWPATMEGAARSGYMAAAAALGEPVGSLLAPERRAGWLYRRLSRA